MSGEILFGQLYRQAEVIAAFSGADGCLVVVAGFGFAGASLRLRRRGTEEERIQARAIDSASRQIWSVRSKRMVMFLPCSGF